MHCYVKLAPHMLCCWVASHVTLRAVPVRCLAALLRDILLFCYFAFGNLVFAVDCEEAWPPPVLLLDV